MSQRNDSLFLIGRLRFGSGKRIDLINKNEDKKLPKQFTGKGEVKHLEFTLVKQSKRAYLYKVDNSYYEVFERRKTALCINFKERKYSDTHFKEIYPKAKDFGMWAWTFVSLDNANDKFMQFIDD